ncbi:MAG: hypothetical protein LJE65_02715, partial [Desulfobacteraceae bacterium]|nr:hypothetical protein [Desulfobacteraceae bacterium]
MRTSKWIAMTLYAAWIALIPPSVSALPPDFNADRRVNVKCPVAIDRDRQGQFALDGFQNTIQRLYRGLDRNLMAAEKDDPEGYSFSADPNEGIFYVCHAKGTFPEGSLPSLSPSSLL